MAKIEKDKYFTPPELAKELIQLTYDTIGDDWERIIEPAAGDGSFLQFLPKNTIAYDIEPQLPNIIQSDYRMVERFLKTVLILRYSLIGKATDFESVLLRSSRSTAVIREMVESGLLRLS